MTDEPGYRAVKDYTAYDAAMTAAIDRYVYGPVSVPKPLAPQFTTDRFVKLEIAVLTAGDVTVAQLTSPAPHNKVYRGSAKRHADDAQNVSIGGSLAIARALRQYADAVEKEAMRLSRQ